MMRRAAMAIVLSLLSATGARAQTQVLIVSGLGGAPRYTQEFGDLAQRLAGAMHSRFGLADSNVTWLGERAVAGLPHYAGESTGPNIEAALGKVASKARPGAEVLLVLIGHGSGSGAESKVSLPGPDLTAQDLARLLAPLSGQRVAVVDLASASGDALGVLSAPGRVVIAATKSSFERNESQFGGFFVDALTKDGADTDKDGRVSLLEAFQYAAHETERYYADGNRIQSEHAQLDDDGDGKGTGAPDGRAGDGLLARRFFLDGGERAVVAAANDPKLAALYARRFSLTDSVQALMTRKEKLPAASYEQELERLLVALSRTGHEIRALEGSAKSGGGAS
ncbi:MAG TPA: hypothetical protein VFK16_05615 [Gemmatimonadaceae bacterium]|nr:hypothetical protein [Gemmatimonadaceae bacterium]